MATLYSPKIVTNGLVMYLDAGNNRSYLGSGTSWTDLSRNNNTGSLVNGPTYSSLNGGSIVFDGTNDYVTAGNIPSGTDLFTLSCWLYFNGNISGNFDLLRAAAIFSGNAVGTIEFLIATSGNAAGLPYQILFSRYGGSTVGSCVLTNINMAINQYHNIVLVRDGTSSQKIYQNGSLIGTGNVSNSFTAGTLYVGGAPLNGAYSAHLNGRVPNILRYDRALSASEVLQNYHATKGRFGL
jgi:hypothetical protein